MKKIVLLLLGLNLFLYANCFYDLTINFNFNTNTIQGKVNLYNSKHTLFLDTHGFTIKNADKLETALKNGANKVSFTYEKKLKNLDEKFIYLLNDWYPRTNTACHYTIKTSLPKEYTTIYEQSLKEIDNLHFIASKDFIKTSTQYNGITIQTYFLRDDKKLAQNYLDKTIEYIKLFEKTIAPFPFKQFSVVENIYQTGYSMPTFTLIGSRLLRKPYILNQSLAHEIVHQYFGNSVTNDFKKGNWIEGLSTYLADDYLKRLANQDIEHRKSVINEYSKFVNKNNEFPINEFEYRFNKASMLIGYSKLSFVFEMLKNKMGDKNFNQLIQKFYADYQFKQANLDDLINFFTTHSNQELEPFFHQWLFHKGMIDFEIKDISTYYSSDGFQIGFEVIQNNEEVFEFDLPIEIQTYNKTLHKTIRINQSVQKVQIKTDSEALKVIFDKNIQLFRKLSPKESPLSIAHILNENRLLAVVNIKQFDQYKWIKKVFPTIRLVNSDVVTFEDLKKHSVIFLDKNNTVLNHIYPQSTNKDNSSYIKVLPHTYNKDKTMTILHDGLNKSRYFYMMKHYSKYQEVNFTQKETQKKMHQTQNGIIKILNDIPTLTQVSQAKKLTDISNIIQNEKIIYVGESHDNFTHHLNQLRIIKALHQKNKDITIGMEMFQTPFQKVIDEYIAGKISLNEFLKRSEYFKRWKFDYNLYRPIIDYAKEHKIPIIALNIDRKITRKVGKTGLLSLTEEEKKLLPKTIDQSNTAYKQSLESIFKEHPGFNSSFHSKAKPNIDFFYQSQLIWDEIMAQNIDNYLEKNPKKTIVVIAGSGHLEKHYGIPKRVFNKNQQPYKVILNDIPSTVIGDITINNKLNLTLSKAKKLGLYLDSSEKMVIQKTVKDSFAQKLGMQKEDILLSINGEKVDTIYDIKRILYFVQDINKTQVRIKRKDKIMDLKLTQ